MAIHRRLKDVRTDKEKFKDELKGNKLVPVFIKQDREFTLRLTEDRAYMDYQAFHFCKNCKQRVEAATEMCDKCKENPDGRKII